MEEKRKILMKELEEMVYKRSLEICNKGESSFDTMKELSILMKQCSDEFEIKVGRPMTSSEMFQMWSK
jgi:hypothetical protein